MGRQGQSLLCRAQRAGPSRLGRGDDIRYVCTPQPEGRLVDAPLARVTADFEEVLGNAEVDLISICTPTDTHVDLPCPDRATALTSTTTTRLAVNRFMAHSCD